MEEVQQDTELIVQLIKSHPELIQQFAKGHLEELWEELDEMVMATNPSYEAPRQPLPPRPLMYIKREPVSGEEFLDLEPEEQIGLLKEAASVLRRLSPMNLDLLETFRAFVNRLSLPKATKAELLQANRE